MADSVSQGGGEVAVFQDCLDFPAAYAQHLSDIFTPSEAHFRVLDLRIIIIVLCAKLTEKWAI